MEKISKRQIQFFQETILNWYKNEGRTFKWREDNLSPYQYVIAEVLLQRTKAETVAKFYPTFLKRFPNWKALQNSSIEEIAEILKPIGLQTQRASRLKNLAVEMVKRKGELPKDREELESIPFMGQYIANAVELIVFEEPSPLIDVNMARVLERFFGPRTLSDIRYDPYLQTLSYRIASHPKSKEISWAVLDFAALICKARVPICNHCPLNAKCSFFKEAKNKPCSGGTINSKL